MPLVNSGPNQNSKPSRLLLVIRLLAGRGGGAERVYGNLANALATRGYEVTAAYCENSQQPPAYRFSSDVTLINLFSESDRKRPIYRKFKRWGERKLPFGLNHLFAWLAKYLAFTLGLRRLIRTRKPSLIISFLPSANTVTLLAGIGGNAKILCTNHNLPEADYDSLKRWDPNPVDRYLRKRLLTRASGISVLFPSFAGYFGKKLAPRMIAIPNFLDFPFFEPVPVLKRKKRIIGSGRLAWEKGYELLILAFAQLGDDARDYELVIYGEGPERTALEALVERLGLVGRVKLPGYDADIRSRLREAEIFCHPAAFEGFALSVAEALSQHLPVVAFRDCSGVNEYVFDEKNGLLVDRQAQDTGLAQALRRLILDGSLRERLSQSAPESVAQFHPDLILAKWSHHINQLTQG